MSADTTLPAAGDSPVAPGPMLEVNGLVKHFGSGGMFSPSRAPVRAVDRPDPDAARRDGRC